MAEKRRSTSVDVVSHWPETAGIAHAAAIDSTVREHRISIDRQKDVESSLLRFKEIRRTRDRYNTDTVEFRDAKYFVRTS